MTDISLQNSYSLTLYVFKIKSIIIVIEWDLKIRHFYSYYNKITDREVIYCSRGFNRPLSNAEVWESSNIQF